VYSTELPVGDEDVKTMDGIVEQGYARLIEIIQGLHAEKQELADAVRKQDAAILARMAQETAPVIREIGLDMLERGKRELSGELYDTQYYPKKMIILGKTDPMPYRPDDPEKSVETQVCVLAEDGVFYELMYSTVEIVVDSYLYRLEPQEALDIYGYEIVFMLYRAMREYARVEQELVDALGRTLEFIAAS